MPVGSKSKTGWYELKPRGKLPDKRSYHGAVIYDGYIYIHGGKDIKEGFYDDMWRLRLSDFKEEDLDEQQLEAAERGETLIWEPVNMHGDVPGKIAYQTAFMQSQDMYVFGGLNDKGENNSDIYTFDMNSCKWTRFEQDANSPSSRDNHSMCLDGDNVYVFGGFVNGVR